MIGIPLLYLRDGFARCILELHPDGSIAGGPGHGEARWRMQDDALVLMDIDGVETGRLGPQDGFYAGTIQSGIPATLAPSQWPSGHAFGGPIGDRLAQIRAARPMRYLLGMPFVNRRDLLDRAIDSVPALQDRLIVIDNSPNRLLRAAPPPAPVLVYEPPVPLTFVQSMNLVQQMAHEAACEVLFVMHNDAEAHPGMDRRLLDRTETAWREDPAFGVLFTNYDALAAFSMRAIRAVGPWETLFTGYFADNEYYARLRNHGFGEIATDIEVIHHGSMTIRSDPRLAKANGILFPAYNRVYEELCR